MIWPFNKPKRDLHEELAAAVSVKVELERKLFLARDDRGKTVAANIELARQLAEACRERDDWMDTAVKRAVALHDIHTAGAASKNGTARKLARMAREAME